MTTDPFETLAAFLRRDFETYRIMVAETDKQEFATAMAAMFFVAMDDKFGSGSGLSDVVKFVAEARIRLDDTGDKVDPQVAERLIRAAAFGEEKLMDGLDPGPIGAAEITLLAALAERDQWTEPRIAELVAESREALSDKE